MDQTWCPVCPVAVKGELLRCNEATAEQGLSLTIQDWEELQAGRRAALADTGRVEFGLGIVTDLSKAVRASPYLRQDNYAETMDHLQDLFYHWKGLCREQASDREVIDALAALFDDPAQGSADYLDGLTGAEILRYIQTGQKPGEGASDDGD